MLKIPIVQEKKFIVFNKPDIGEEEMSAVMDIMRSGWIGTGKVCHQFEEEFAEFMGGGYAVGVSSCTMGLQLALNTLEFIGGIGEVITTPLTFAATLNSILATGLDPILVDVDYFGSINMNEVEKKVHNLTKAIMPVHLSGIPCAIKKFNGVLTVEDCAHAFGSKLKRQGDIQVFSFYANKNITCGEGGMVLTRDKKVADEIRILSSQGMSHGAWERYGSGALRNYSIEKVGTKGNLPDILAAIGLVQLKRWPEMKQKRKEIWKIYEKAFGIIGDSHSTHFYPLRVKNRDFVRQRLHVRGIGTGIHYKPLHLEPAYEFLGYKPGDFPMAESWGREEISLPVSSTMTEKDAIYIVESIQEVTK